MYKHSGTTLSWSSDILMSIHLVVEIKVIGHAKINKITFVLDMILREVDCMHGGRRARASKRVSEPRGVVVSQRGGAPAEPLRGRRGAAHHARQRLPRLAPHPHPVPAHALEPRVVLQRYQQRYQVPTRKRYISSIRVSTTDR